MQANPWLTLRCLLWGAFQVKASRKLVSRSRVAESINLAFDWYQSYWKCLQWSKSRRMSTCLRVERASIRTSWWGGTVEETKFLSYSSPVDMHNRHWFSLMQCHHTLMWELENGVVWGEPEVLSLILVSILHASALLKAVLSFDFVNTSGQKPCALCAYFTHPY